jgi:hypothetical protein
MPETSISRPPSPISGSSPGRSSGSTGTPGEPTDTTFTIRSPSITTSTGPTGGAPVPSIRVPPRRIRRG